jgi:transposase
MKLYGGIDLHSNNSVLSLLDENDRLIYEQRLANELDIILVEVAPYREALVGLVVESTYNWYWLVDGLMEAGYTMHLSNPAATKRYEGLKYTDDRHDARWLARMLRLGILEQGYIYPKAERAVRDLLRKRAQLVRLQTSQILSIENLLSRNTGRRLNSHRIKRLSPEELGELLAPPEPALAAQSNLVVLKTVMAQIKILEEEVKARVKPRSELRWLKTVAGVGEILGWTIVLESGDIRRFSQVGRYASYCRCVESKCTSNGKKKGENNRKNGNQYLAWAFVEAANFAVRYHDRVKRYYQRKRSRTNGIVAIKACAHKLARASYYVQRDQVAFDMTKAFG